MTLPFPLEITISFKFANHHGNMMPAPLGVVTNWIEMNSVPSDRLIIDSNLADSDVNAWNCTNLQITRLEMFMRVWYNIYTLNVKLRGVSVIWRRNTIDRFSKTGIILFHQLSISQTLPAVIASPNARASFSSVGDNRV